MSVLRVLFPLPSHARVSRVRFPLCLTRHVPHGASFVAAVSEPPPAGPEHSTTSTELLSSSLPSVCTSWVWPPFATSKLPSSLLALPLSPSLLLSPSFPSSPSLPLSLSPLHRRLSSLSRCGDPACPSVTLPSPFSSSVSSRPPLPPSSSSFPSFVSSPWHAPRPCSPTPSPSASCAPSAPGAPSFSPSTALWGVLAAPAHPRRALGASTPSCTSRRRQRERISCVHCAWSAVRSAMRKNTAGMAAERGRRGKQSGRGAC